MSYRLGQEISGYFKLFFNVSKAERKLNSKIWVISQNFNFKKLRNSNETIEFILNWFLGLKYSHINIGWFVILQN